MVLLGMARGGTVPNDMGSFRVDVELENPARPGQRRTVRSVLVDTGAELSWVPANVRDSWGVERNNQWLFRRADGTVLERRGPGARRGNRVSRLIPGLAPGVSTTFPRSEEHTSELQSPY